MLNMSAAVLLRKLIGNSTLHLPRMRLRMVLFVPVSILAPDDLMQFLDSTQLEYNDGVIQLTRNSLLTAQTFLYIEIADRNSNREGS